MGLDMYLEGEKFYWTDWKHPEKNLQEDGYELKTKRLRLGYWRKHPDLHGFIVQRFAKGVDDCRDLELANEDVQEILDAVKASTLPHTEGFFFGHTDGSEDEETIAILEKAIAWVDGKATGDKTHCRSIVYRASW